MPILMYHHVNSAPPPDEFEARLTVTDADFSRQLEFLKCAGYTTVTMSQLFDGIYGGAPLPARPVVLTFDDGFADAFANTFPLLQQHGLGGTFLIVTSFVGQDGYVTWEQVQNMARSGMEIVSHSVNHSNLATSPDESVRRELGESKRVLEEKLGLPVPFFAYPAGEPFYKGTPERQAQVVAMVQEAGYRGALAVKNSLTQDPAAPFAFSRVRVTGGVELRKFAENMGAPLPETIGC